MKVIYRNCDIKSSREEALGGWSEVYWSAFRKSDGYEIASGFGGGTVRECFADMKRAVNEFLDDFKGDEDAHQGR